MYDNNLAPVLFNEIPAKYGKLGLINLNRPEALNAISMQMILLLSDQLHAWAEDSEIKAVIIRGNGERAFSAGGDLKQLYVAGIDNFEQAIPFFGHEYKLNKFIHLFPKPYIALLHGVTMGGGLGLSVHGSHVVAAPDLKMAMPEVGIGHYPDTGGSFFLSECPNFLGMYMGLTGNTITVADAIYCGLIQNCVHSDKFQALIDTLCSIDLRDNPESIISHNIAQFAAPVPGSELAQYIDIIKTCFSLDSVEKIVASLHQTDNPWAQQQAKIILSKSPTSLKVTHKALTVGAKIDINKCMQLEHHLTTEILQRHDIYEGIRAVLIDKTRDPKWLPATLAEVPDRDIDKMFEIKWTT